MKSVCVLMSTYNGEKYLREQIDSILNQEKVTVQLIVRDDGSTDRTVEILREYEARKKIRLYTGVNIGYKKSFYWLLDHAPKSDYYAFADQDDVWLEKKLSRAVTILQSENLNIPLLYTSGLQCVDENLEYLRMQDFPNLKISYRSEFVRHRFAGCTYVFNGLLRDRCKGASEIDELNYGHDGFVAIMCWLAGGKVVYDRHSEILFRRHGGNASVDGGGLKKRIRNELALFTFKRNYKRNLASVIVKYFDISTVPEYGDFTKTVADYKSSLKSKFKLLFAKGCDCGIPMANIIFKLSVLCGVL